VSKRNRDPGKNNKFANESELMEKNKNNGDMITTLGVN
jgi:hypothetical protein